MHGVKLPFFRRPPKAGALSLLVSGVVFCSLSLYQHAQALRVVPVLTQYLAPGIPVTARDIRWEPVSQVEAVSVALGQYARMALVPGEILAPAMLSPRPGHGVIVAVSPASSGDLGVARAGGRVNVLVMGSKGLLWQSGGVPVVNAPSSSLLGSGGGSVEVVLTMPQALAFDRVKAKGTVSLVGVTS
ncbi:MAG: hypothetical protein M0Z53_14150 [Thermaerobacter sp.]|nr:hypothetical protein [Thermaerobacter sp.]